MESGAARRKERRKTHFSGYFVLGVELIQASARVLMLEVGNEDPTVSHTP